MWSFPRRTACPVSKKFNLSTVIRLEHTRDSVQVQRICWASTPHNPTRSRSHYDPRIMQDRHITSPHVLPISSRKYHHPYFRRSSHTANLEKRLRICEQDLHDYDRKRSFPNISHYSFGLTYLNDTQHQKNYYSSRRPLPPFRTASRL